MPLFRLALLLLVVPSLVSAQTQDGGGEVALHVKDATGHPLTAHGVLYGPTAGHSRAVEVAADGSVMLSHLAFGRYQLRLTQTGYLERIVDLQVTSARPLRREITMPLAGFSTIVTVIASTPIGTLDIPVVDVPVPIQSLNAKTLEDTNALDLTDAMKRRMNGVYVNENQNNPFQPDVNYRGYTASPLVGSPAGLSVYVDGVRQNQPFGDVVAWDLIPKVAINTVELIPGSNPVYGLNTLGGAIAVQTKSGLTHAGYGISGYGGSFGRRAVDAQYGGSNNGGWNWFAAGTLFHEDGWRVQSPSSVRQSFVKLGYDHGTTSLSLSGGYAINDLTGTAHRMYARSQGRQA